MDVKNVNGNVEFAVKHLRSDMASPPSGSYSQGLIVNGFLFTCGMGPVNPATGLIVEGNVGVQTRQVLTNLRALLSENGVSFSQVIKVTTHLQDLHRDFAEYDLVYKEFFSKPYPVRTTVGATLANELIAIDLVAFV